MINNKKLKLNNKIIKITIDCAIMLLLLFAIISIVKTLIHPISSCIDINTESISGITLSEPSFINFNIGDNLYYKSKLNNKILNLNDISGAVKIYPFSTVSFKRIGKNYIYIDIKKNNGKNLTLVGTNDDIIDEVDDNIRIKIFNPSGLNDKSNSFLFLFYGNINDIILKNIVFQSTPIIRSGKIFFNIKTCYGNNYFTIGPYPINTGDSIFFNDKNNINGHYGLVTINDESGVQLIVINNNKKVNLSRFGTNKFTIEANILNVIINDPILNKIFIIVASAIPLLHNIKKIIFRINDKQ